MDFFNAAGKKLVHVRKDIPGFIGNRLQTALAREAMSLVQRGVASPEDVDTVIKFSLALRMPFSGILEQRDLNGLDTHLAVTETLYPNLEDAKEPCRCFEIKWPVASTVLRRGGVFTIGQTKIAQRL